ncbi:hypothetical protein BDV19DRAFT_395546 [Aspergillus venezuelensis]
MASTDYVFTRDLLDNNRLNLQHYLWIELFGYHIHPTITSETQSLSSLRVADIGTGTGIWLTDLARRLPTTATLDGLDISFDAVPPGECLPANMTLYHFDVKSDVPDHLRSVYDIVHIRLLSFVLQDCEIDWVARNIMQLLKPGGYIQWAEPDVSSFRIETTGTKDKDVPQIQALTELLHVSQSQDPRLSPTWVPRLPAIFQSLGLDGVQSDVRDAPPDLAMASHCCNLAVHELIARKTGNDEVSAQLQLIIPGAVRESNLGAFWAFTRWTVIGQRSRNA